MHPKSVNWLNVVLHGLFVIHIRHDHIELLTPLVHEHVYYAGDWVYKVADLKDRPRLEEGQSYRLIGVNEFMECPPISFHSNTVLSKSKCGFRVRADRSYCKVRLPFPSDLVPLRSQQIPLGPIYAGKDAGKIHANGVSLCQALIYPVASFDDVRLWGTSWRPKPKDVPVNERICYHVANLHLWAEPKEMLSAMHGTHAYRALMKLLPPLELEPVVEITPIVQPAPYPGIPGLTRCELYGLAELGDLDPGACNPKSNAEGEKAAPGTFGSHVTNCQSVTVF